LHKKYAQRHFSDAFLIVLSGVAMVFTQNNVHFYQDTLSTWQK